MSLDQGPDPLNAGVRHLQAGRLGAARLIFQEILERRPGHPDALHLLGLAAYQGGDFEDAIHQIRQAIERQPDNPAFHSSLGLSLKATGRLDDAARAFADALTLYPDFSDAHFNLGIVRGLQGRPQDAVHHFAAALKSMPDDAETRFQLARNQERMGDAVTALDGYRRLIDARPDFIAPRFALASMPRDLVGLDEALSQLDAIVAMAPGDGDAHAARAATLEQAGRLDEARVAAERAVAASPDRIDPQIAMAAVELREDDADAARRRLQQLFDRPMDESAMAGAGHLLAQALDRLGDPAGAFAAQGDSQRLYEREPAASLIDREAFPRMVDDLRQWARPDRFRQWPKHGPDDGLPTPAFLVGFPRSGTTLVEQVLASHPNLMATGEEQFVFSLVDSLRRGGGPTYPACLDDLTEADVRRLRAVYWRACQDTFGEGALQGRLLDKMPLNIIHLPLIRRLFPDSPIIVALRDPRDVCLSCFMQRFGLNFAMIHFTRIETTARLYAAVMDLWLHYKECLDLSMVEYRYEDLTADFETTTTRLLRFLGEDWDESILGYAETARTNLVATPSYRDVTKPISGRAVGRWKRYEAGLAPVLDTLSPFVRAFGYDG